MRNGLLLAMFVCGCSSPPPPPKLEPSAQLLSVDYQLDPGQELYLCKWVTVEKDMLIHSITPIEGQATHHQVLAIETTANVPDGTAPCDTQAEFNVLTWKMLFASGVGSPTLTMPDNVALPVHAGDQLVLQLHLLNASTNAISSTASLDVVTLEPSAQPLAATMILAGPLPIHKSTPDIPVGDNQVVTGGCTFDDPTHYFAVFPHMHQIGKHIQVTATVGGTPTTVYDADYSFDNQVFAEFKPLDLKPGDKIGVTCTYDNQTGQPVHFGQSSLNEMCFAISYLYPPVPVGFGGFCSQ
jgi:hypothetical protein